ncbi:hypothetical protein AA309_07205 [Microvirga vignae]|uniref:Uncharacterized protein n=1 Tax=Microvirga vignae TaxID=1225564 RepID=A0A0H1RFF1_9HYPH|nr:hypothetical protein AA309_07205 [Microvirga vignae]
MLIRPFAALQEKTFVTAKVDHHLDGRERIVPTIFSSIKRSAFIIVEMSGAKPNIYFELGYARALGKPIIQMHTKAQCYHSMSLIHQIYSGIVRTRSNVN